MERFKNFKVNYYLSLRFIDLVCYYRYEVAVYPPASR